MHRVAHVAIRMAVLAVLTGCGDSKSGASGSGGRSDTPAAKDQGIVGTWVYDGATPAEGVAEAARKAVEASIQAMPKMSVEYVFAADGTFTLKEHVLNEDDSNLTGTWELKDGKYAVTEKTKNGKPRTATDPNNTVQMELKDGRLSFAAPDAPIAFHLKRK